MSVSAKNAKFPVACANGACAQALCGPVNHCPFCGTAVQRAAAVPLAAVGVAVPVSAPLAAAVPVSEAVAPPVVAVTPAPVVVPVSVTQAPPSLPVAAVKAKGRGKKIALVALGIFAIYGINHMSNVYAQKQMETALQAGKSCLGQKDFNCAIENADKVLSNDRNEPRALSLKQQAQTGLARWQKAEDDKQARLKADAAQKASAEQARVEQARVREQQAQAAREQQELDARRRSEEQDLRAQQMREQRAEDQRLQELRTQEQLARQQRAREEQAQTRNTQQRRPQGSGNYVMPQNMMNESNVIYLPSQNGQQRNIQNRSTGQGQDSAQDRIRSIIQ